MVEIVIKRDLTYQPFLYSKLALSVRRAALDSGLDEDTSKAVGFDVAALVEHSHSLEEYVHAEVLTESVCNYLKNSCWAGVSGVYIAHLIGSNYVCNKS